MSKCVTWTRIYFNIGICVCVCSYQRAPKSKINGKSSIVKRKNEPSIHRWLCCFSLSSCDRMYSKLYKLYTPVLGEKIVFAQQVIFALKSNCQLSFTRSQTNDTKRKNRTDKNLQTKSNDADNLWSWLFILKTAARHSHGLGHCVSLLLHVLFS